MRKMTLGGRIAMIVAFILIAIIAVAVISLLVKVNKDTTTKNIGATYFTVGSLDETTGKVNAEDKTNQNAYTKDLIKTDGLNIKLADDAKFTVKVFYYGKDYSFLSKADVTAGTELTVPDTAKYCRVMVTLNGAEQFDLTGMARHMDNLTITVNK